MTNPIWPFTKQIAKDGYINNPYWTDVAEDSSRHHPCGYWPMGEVPALPILPLSGKIYSTGYNLHYQLGLGDPIDRDIFTLIPKDFIIKDVMMGLDHSMVLEDNGNLWAVGYNTSGQLGLGDYVNRTNWTQVNGSWECIAGTHSHHHTIGIKLDGTLWATGINSWGQLGLGDTVTRNSFTQVGSSNDWTKIETGGKSSMAINSVGDLYVAGSTVQGALGLGAGVGSNSLIISITNVSEVSCGYETTIIIKDGVVFGTGSNGDGQFGDGTTNPSGFFKPLSIGNDNVSICESRGGTGGYSGTSFIVKSNGQLWAAGSNGNYQMGIADISDQLNFVQLTGNNWIQIASGMHSTLGIRSNGELWGTGLNSYGELGMGDSLGREEFARIGSDVWIKVINSETSSFAISREEEFIWV